MNLQASGWVEEVVDFLVSNLPGSVESGGWDHMASSAYQVGCEALISLGHAEKADRGAIPTSDPALPHTLPRWDDVSLAILRLGHQAQTLTYSVAGADQPKPTIAARGTAGAAVAEPATQLVLTSLGLIEDGHWSEQAETLLWREQPHEWQMDVTGDPRFVDGAQKAIDALPKEIGEEIDILMTITESDVEAAIAEQKVGEEERRKAHGMQPWRGQSKSPEQIRSSLIYLRTRELDSVFFRRWRLSDVWLTSDQVEHSLYVFYDPLARQMRRAAIKTLYPNRPEFLQ